MDLEELLLDGNKLKLLPNFLGNITKLKHLDASFNQLETVSQEIGNCISLVDLTLSSNDLKVSFDPCNESSFSYLLLLDDINKW